ncbi:Glyoxylase, beta-lactamase superfamily II [Ruegeria intermedia]|uniref:Glyoxylase, beta-lactamase superfamily II n=1 Tax=Ruegeria intermedia TaxID=996115 RepID=A0A1M4W0D1_9RHOB|nr:MBL fold metallo-hydrolase [Ruegeria intermedia]SHE74754.1 Glyoxylase, beta-lactamase superfamily II [Ruegeria intermedia]
MDITRRMMLQTMAAMPLAGGLPVLTRADISMGTAMLTTVSDGHLVLPASFIFDPMPKDELGQILADYGISSEKLEPECNLTLYRDGDHTVLFDAGAGPDFAPTAGSVLDSLDAAGVSAADITHVVFTHAHPDHIWGVLDDFDELVFPDATYMMGRAEWDFWWNPETVNTIGEARAAHAVGAKRRMTAIEDRVRLFDDDQEILPGIAAVSTPGHTPGHMAFEIRQGNSAVLVVGDAIGNHHVAFRRPAWHSGSDQDAETAATTRQVLFDRLTHEDLTLIGFHLPGGGIGRAEKAGDGFRFVGAA